MVNRSEGDAHPDSGPTPEREFGIQFGRRRRRDDVEFNELDVKVRVSYRTLLLVFVLFDVFHKFINSSSVSDFIQGIFPG